MSRLAKRLLSIAAAIPFGCVLNGLAAGTASAHVKWFCAFDVAGQPEGRKTSSAPISNGSSASRC